MGTDADTVVMRRVRVRITGAVQGVGFRPFVFRLAQRYGVSGWVANDGAGVIVEVEAADAAMTAFLAALEIETPPHAVVHGFATEPLAPQGDTGFRIQLSGSAGARSAVILPDLATCSDCLAEVRSRDDRRGGYAFTNCTNCGPRFSIIRALPYDRPNTTMAAFAMCEPCAAEYGAPADRRFHAQPNACPDCGPQLTLLDAAGRVVRTGDPIGFTADAIAAGAIVAVKGIGGFHLMVDACNGAAVETLRARKTRPSKPFAIMAASVEQARRFVQVDDAAVAHLHDAAAPVVLLPRRAHHSALVTAAPLIEIDEGVAPGNPYLGVMLAATPLHHLLLEAFGGPVVATSGNLAEEPLCIDNDEALTRLRTIAELFLVHDRPIERHVDDSVTMIADGAPRMVRRARGFAPMPVMLRTPVAPVLALGGQLRNTIALTRGRQVFVSQHIGDLENLESQHAFTRVVDDFLRMYETEPEAVVHDMHPDYHTTSAAHRIAGALGVRTIAVQHHHAHHAACLAENGDDRRAFGIVWDGTGYGTDGTIWGGEFLGGDLVAFDRLASLLPFRLPGGAAAVREPRRTAMSLLATASESGELDGVLPWKVAETARQSLLHMIETGLNSPVTTSMGRLFDGVAALLGLCDHVTYSGEAAVRLEYAADPGERGGYEIPVLAAADLRTVTDAHTAPLLLDWRPMVLEIMADLRRGAGTARVAARFHNGLVHAAVQQAQLAGLDRVTLTGGCFHNRLLLERCAVQLRRQGFTVLQHSAVPAGDGGISLGQAAVATARLGRA